MEDLGSLFVQRMKIQRYSTSTIKSYENAITNYVSFLRKGNIEIGSATISAIETYLAVQIKEKHISRAYHKHLLGAIKLFYQLLFDKKLSLTRLYPARGEYKLPVVLSPKKLNRFSQKRQI